MKHQAIEALKRSRYKILTESQDLEKVYRLRYKGYLAEQAIDENERGLMTDSYDDTENCVHVAVEMDGEIMAAMRLHVISETSPSSPSLETFPEILDYLKPGETALDPTRFVINPAARKQRVPLHFLVMRIPFLATMAYNIDLALAAVRVEHTPFYRRYLGYDLAIGPRSYPWLTKPLQLLTSNVWEQRDAVLARTPIFGPINDIPHSNIAFPNLSGNYVALKNGRSKVA